MACPAAIGNRCKGLRIDSQGSAVDLSPGQNDGDSGLLFSHAHNPAVRAAGRIGH